MDRRSNVDIFLRRDTLASGFDRRLGPLCNLRPGGLSAGQARACGRGYCLTAPRLEGFEIKGRRLNLQPDPPAGVFPSPLEMEGLPRGRPRADHALASRLVSPSARKDR